MFAHVALNIPSNKIFSYSVPDELAQDVCIGKRILVPFGKRRMTGYVVALNETKERDDVKDIIEILDQEPLFSESDLTFYRWMSDYYMHPLGKALKSILPGGIDVESNQWIYLSQEIDRFTNESLSPAQLKIIDILCGNPAGMPSKKLKKEINKSNLYDDIKKLKELGCITVEDRLKKPTVTRKTQKIVRLEKDRLVAIKLTEKQQQIIDFLEKWGDTPLSVLNDTFKNASTVVRRLEKKEVVSFYSEELYRNPDEFSDIGTHERPETLTGEQQSALQEIVRGISSRRYSPYLLHGVTGSGKTEVYFKAIEEVLQTGGSVIFLVPEISLTPQLLSRVKERFEGSDVAVLHSGISKSEKYDEWRRIRRRAARIVIGVRSAIFAPGQNLRLIIVDEEHDTSYKQDDRITYNARNLAVVKAKLNSATIILGTATPAIQTTYNARERDFRYLRLDRRIDDRPLPHIVVIDMKNEKDDRGKVPILSRPLKTAIQETLRAEKQSLLFLNRRGFTTFLYCLDCGHVFKCLNCSVSMTHHIRDNLLRCHYCNYTLKAPPMCPQCRGYRINSYGIGTEKVEEEVNMLFPESRVQRMDSDTMQSRGAYVRILKALDRGDIDILIGTQMITKGHDYPNVTLVGVLSADTALNLPDFRAAEKTFQIITQVSGRGGRGDTPGRVILQTFNPDHYAIRRACNYDCHGFYSDEISIRQELRYPPYSRMVNFRISSVRKESAEQCAMKLAAIARELSCNGKMKNAVRIMGPAEAPIAKIKGRHRWNMLLLGENVNTLHSFSREMLAQSKTADANIKVDVDPMNFM